MITLTFYRFAPALLHDKNGQAINYIDKKGHEKTVFLILEDHKEYQLDSQCTIKKAKELADMWKKDHYGHVVIEQNGTIIKVNNYQDMVTKFHELGLEVIVKKGLYDL